jgi:hypothetical protein
MRAIASVLAVIGLLLAISACSSGSESSTPEISSSGAQLAAAQETPAFRNLGKRGDSKL